MTTLAISELKLPTLADEVNAAHRLHVESSATAIAAAIQAGELLIKAKAEVRHGKWSAWIRDNCDFEMRTAQKYMQAAKYRKWIEWRIENAPAGAHLGLNDCLKLLSQALKANKPTEKGVETYGIAVPDVDEAAVWEAEPIDPWVDGYSGMAWQLEMRLDALRDFLCAVGIADEEIDKVSQEIDQLESLLLDLINQ